MDELQAQADKLATSYACVHCGEPIYPVVHSSDGTIKAYSWSTVPDDGQWHCPDNSTYPMHHAPDSLIYVVWGPTAEWGDGVGPLGWHESEESALADIDWHKDSDKDYAYEVASSMTAEEFKAELEHANEQGWSIETEYVTGADDLTDAELVGIFAGWPVNQCDYSIAEETLGYFDLPFDVVVKGIDAVLDYLNEN